MSYRERYEVTDAEDRKPQSDEARSRSCSDGTPSTGHVDTSEFAIPEGLAVPGRPVRVRDDVRVRRCPRGWTCRRRASAEPEGSAFSTPRTYSVEDAPSGFTPRERASRVISLTKDVPWQDRMRTMLRMPVAERPAPEPMRSAREDERARPSRACST